MSSNFRIRPYLRPIKSLFLQSYNWAARQLTGMKEKERNSDAIIIGHPKTGTTWLATLLSQVLMRQYHIHNDSIRSIYSVSAAIPSVPTIVFTHDDLPHLKRIPDFETSKKRYRHKMVVFLARDPRDVLVSYYFWYNIRKDKMRECADPFAGSLSEFIDHDIGGLDNIITFYNIWAENRHVPRQFCLITYEDLQSDTYAHFLRLLRFLEIAEPDSQVITQAIEFSRFDNMRKLEQKGVSGLQLPANVAPEHVEGYKTRKGKVGGYVDYFTDQEIARMDEKINAKLSDYYSFYKYRTQERSRRGGQPIHYKSA